MKKWKKATAGICCVISVFTSCEISVSAEEEIPEQKIVYWSMWEEEEPQAEVIQDAAMAFEEATGISVEIQWKGREITSLIGPALDAGEQIDLFDDDYQRMSQDHSFYLAELEKMADTVDYEDMSCLSFLTRRKNGEMESYMLCHISLTLPGSGIIRNSGKKQVLQKMIFQAHGNILYACAARSETVTPVFIQ